MEFTISQEIEDMIKKGKKNALMRCALYGHDYQEVDGIAGGKICICCGSHPNQPLEPTIKMDFKEALKKLGIEECGERIFDSNSHGELFHLYDYIEMAEFIEDTSWFKTWFDAVVEFAENNWNRPESVFQHIPKILQASLKKHNKSSELTEDNKPC